MIVEMLLTLATLALQPPVRAPSTVTNVVPADVPAAARVAIDAAVPGMRIDEVARKEREGRIYLDVEGKRPGGEEVELDLLLEGDGWRVVEIQRDLAWSATPASVRQAVERSGRAIDPVRVIESRQSDQSIVYELFAAGQADAPSLEVRVADGRTEILREEWPH